MGELDIKFDDSIIKVDECADALTIAKINGVFSRDAKRLHKTVTLIKDLRQAKQMSDWGMVQKILSETDVGLERPDPIADREIFLTNIQLDLRSSLTDLQAALQVGSAHCVNGIVDSASIEVLTLSNALSKLEECIEDLGKSNAVQKEEKDVADASLPTASSDGTSPEKNSLGKGTKLGKPSRRMSVREKIDTHFSVDSLLHPSIASPSSSEGPSGDGNNTTATAGATAAAGAAAGAVNEHRDGIVRAVDSIVLSANIVLKMRRLLQASELETAGLIAEKAIANDAIHRLVISECKLYASEVGKALRILKLSRALREGIRTGNIYLLQDKIRSAVSEETRDLGFLRIIEKAQESYKKYANNVDNLAKIGSVFDPSLIQRAIDSIVNDQSIPPQVLARARDRIQRLTKFNWIIEELSRSCGGMLYGRKVYHSLIEAAFQLHLADHPVARKVSVLNAMNYECLNKAVIVDAISSGGVAYAAATQTILLKRTFLALESSRAKFSFEKFPKWRSMADFTLGSVVNPSKQYSLMFQYSDQPLPTSLTQLPAPLSALAVWIFSHNIRGIERHIYSHSELLLREIVLLGRSCLPMRDEILAQHVKLLRNHPDAACKERLWRSLSACLHYFPPSQMFECYLELFLIQEGEKYCENNAGKLSLVHRCIRNMHETIFLHGYSKKLKSSLPLDSEHLSMKTMSIWLECNVSEDIDHHDIKSMRNSMLIPSATTDAAFNTALQDPMSPLDESSIRGTRANWSKRFNAFSSGVSQLNLAEFTKCLSSVTVNNTANYDKKDLEVLLLLIMGTWPKRRRTLMREFFSDDSLYHYRTDEERELSGQRRGLLRLCCGPPIGKPNEIATGCLSFWRTIVQRLFHPDAHMDSIIENDLTSSLLMSTSLSDSKLDAVMTADLYRDIILAGEEWLSGHGRDMILRGRHVKESSVSRLTDNAVSSPSSSITESKKENIDSNFTMTHNSYINI
jgi:hypothetical protein